MVGKSGPLNKKKLPSPAPPPRGHVCLGHAGGNGLRYASSAVADCGSSAAEGAACRGHALSRRHPFPAPRPYPSPASPLVATSVPATLVDTASAAPLRPRQTVAPWPRWTRPIAATLVPATPLPGDPPMPLRTFFPEWATSHTKKVINPNLGYPEF